MQSNQNTTRAKSGHIHIDNINNIKYATAGRSWQIYTYNKTVAKVKSVQER